MFMLFFPAETYGLPSLLSGKKKKKKYAKGQGGDSQHGSQIRSALT